MELDDFLGERARFSNRIHHDYPQLRWFFSRDWFLSRDLYQNKLRSEYDFRIRGLVPWNDVYYRLFTFRRSSNLELRVNDDYETPSGYPMNVFLYDVLADDWSPKYGERFIYINIIRLVQNLIKHGAEYHEVYT